MQFISYKKDLKGQFNLSAEASTLNKLIRLENLRPVVIKEKYTFLKDLELTDVSKSDELDLNLNIRLQELCNMRTGKIPALVTFRYVLFLFNALVFDDGSRYKECN